jgi:outer membrane usher protein
MGSVRYGLRDWLTLEGHAEATTRLGVGGVGAVMSAGRLGVFSFAAAASHYKGNTGALTYASWQQSYRGFFLGASTQRTFGRYEDVASVTAPAVAAQGSSNFANSGFFMLQRSPRIAKAIDRITLGVPLSDWKASLAISFINIERATKDLSHLLSVSYSQTIADKYHFFVNGYADIANKRDAGIVAGLSFTLGPDITLSTSGAFSRDGRSGGFEASRSLGQNPHDYAWRVYDSEGTNSQRGANATYRNPWSRIEAGIRQDRNMVSGFGGIDGALVATPAGVFASNRINDAFAVVDAGAPGVEIMHENRPVGKTDWSGKLLIPNLQSFQKAKIAINPESLPRDKLANITETEVMPGYRGAATVAVKSLSVSETARVELRDTKGEPLQVGTRVFHTEADETYTIGYGGIAYLPKIDDQNTLVVQQGTSTCRAVFARADRAGPKGKVGPLTCHPQ